MIKNGDLKPKNIIHYVCDETEELLICVIDWQDIKMLVTNEILFNNLHKPIPLTEEILLKCGFEKSNDLDKFYHLDLLNEWTRIYFNPKHNICTLSINQHDSRINIQYLHELQNLVFSLNQKELTIQL